MRGGRFQWARAYASMKAGSENAYTILGLERDCRAENVRAAFRELAKATHPDKQPGVSGAASSEHFVRVLAAYQILADPRKRALYDAQLEAQEVSQRRKVEFYHRQNYHWNDNSFKRRRGFDRAVDPSETDGGFSDHSASINQPERQEFVCPETEAVEWLKHYRAAVTSAVHRREIGVGGGLLEGVRGEFGSALRKAYHGPPVYEEKGIPDCFEADERADPHVGSDILQLVSGHNLFGSVRVPQQPMLESLQSHIKAIDDEIGEDTSGYKTDCSHVNSFNHFNLGHKGHSRSMHDNIESSGNRAVESEYVDLELQVFGKVIARASRVEPESSSPDGSKSGDRIYVYSALAQESHQESDEERLISSSRSNLIGTIHGLGDVNPQLVCAVYGPDGKSTHRIVQHHSPLVKQMTWFNSSGRCECRCRRASLLPSRYWLFAPRSATHNIGGWYIETWNNQVLHKKRHSVRTGDEYGVVELSGQENLSRINPAMYIIAAAYKTLDEEAAKRRKFSKFIEFSTKISTFTLWCKEKLKLSRS
ncbi:hypothetical protein KC19_9G057500 [Ceratodon purpureus]|uniref:J domain-containing protein n=1 Tax=Ceratodon purpureus TaxID=3225 RepID=A0A8T0GRX6_CERPU|nr:hypothetical protein KC19_9G057500 [Ceratodon purpureus]